MGGFVVAEVLPDEGGDYVGRNIGDQTKPNPATASTTFFDRGGDDRLLLGRPPRFARLRTAGVALVDPDLAGQGLVIGPDDCAADLLQPRPCHLITAEPELALQPGGRNALLRRR